MRSRYLKCAAMMFASILWVGPVFGQTPMATEPSNGTVSQTPQPSTPVAVDSDDSFMTGLRRIGVMAGEVVQCTPENERKTPIADSMELANLVALHFGLAAAFSFSGAVGYGAGKPFDKVGCAKAIGDWGSIKQKYLNR